MRDRRRAATASRSLTYACWRSKVIIMPAAMWSEARAALMTALRGPWVPPRLGRTPYLWLISLAFFGWKYFYVRPSAWELVALLVTLAVFFPVYFASFWVRNRAVVPYILVTF